MMYMGAVTCGEAAVAWDKGTVAEGRDDYGGVAGEGLIEKRSLGEKMRGRDNNCDL